MKLSKTFLTGILVFALVFVMALTGCENGSSGGDNNNGGGGDGGNPLLGSWVDVRANPTQVFIFTDEADAAITGARVAYYSTALTQEATAATGSQITIGQTAYTYTLHGNTLTLNAYGSSGNVVFDRAQGTSGSTMHGVWVSRLASTDVSYTLLIIRTGSAVTFTSVGAANWGESPYTLSSDANTMYIKWGNANPIAYTKTSNPDQLDITPPGANQPITGLITLGGSW